LNNFEWRIAPDSHLTYFQFVLLRSSFRYVFKVLGCIWEGMRDIGTFHVIRERVRDLASPLRFMLRRSSLEECARVLHGTCLQCAEQKNIHQYVKPYEEYPRYTFLTIKSSLCSHINSCFTSYFYICRLILSLN
jgi:hypothetical protein